MFAFALFEPDIIWIVLLRPMDGGAERIREFEIIGWNANVHIDELNLCGI